MVLDKEEIIIQPKIPFIPEGLKFFNLRILSHQKIYDKIIKGKEGYHE